MEIHKPTPIYSWREFLIELGTITLGVCIALAAEQTAEWWHWHEKTAYASQQIQLELSDAMFYSMERIMVADCVQRRFDELEMKVLASGGKWTPVTPASTLGVQAGNAVALPIRRWSAIAWTAAVADTSVTHFNRDLLTSYARIYGAVMVAHDENEREFETVAGLNVLLRPVTVSDDKKVELVGAIEKGLLRNREMAVNATRLIGAWKEIGLDPQQGKARVVRNSTTYAACRAQSPR